jgi:hypothetical protein
MTSFLNVLKVLGETKETKETFAKTSPATGNLINPNQPSIAGPVAPADTHMEQEGFASPFVSKEAAQKSDTEVAQAGKPDLVKQALGIDLAGQALSLVGGLQNIRGKEQDAMSQIAAQYNISKENLEGNTNLRNMATGASRSRELLNRIRGISRQGPTGGVQRQQFISDPGTGGLV